MFSRSVARLLSIWAWLFVACACVGAGANQRAKLGEPSPEVDPAVVGAAVRENSGQFQHCFQAARERNPTLAGQVEIRFLINPDGSVGQAEAFQTNLPLEVADCVVNAFYNVRLPPRPEAVIAQYPMYFAES